MFGFFGDAADMEKAATKLKILRKSAVPKLTVRGMAEALSMPHGSYARYESTYDYKKNFLPVDLARKIAAVLAQHGIDPAEVMALAGLTEAEAEPEARQIEALRPDIRFISLPIALPNEDALADMFESLLELVPADATRAEAARILARRLPTGFAAIGPLTFDQVAVPSPAALTGSPTPSRAHPATEPSSRS